VGIVIDLLQFYLVLIFVRIIMSWFPINPWSKGARYLQLLVKVTDPVLVPIRRLIPPLRIGAGALDLSPMIVILAIEILVSTLR
jgi:YggT family protein